MKTYYGSIRVALILLFLGFFTSTWDNLLTLDLGGFTLKIHQFLFGISFLFTLASGKWREFRRLIQPFSIAMLALATYYLASSFRSYFPLKSFLYSGWLIFNLLTIWANSVLLSDQIQRGWVVIGVATTVAVHAAIVLVDHAAYQFGFVHGLIGFNQDTILQWGISRPHAFSSEPSYIATFLYFGTIFLYASFPARRSITSLSYAGVILLGIGAILSAASRSGWFGLGAGIIACITLEALFRRGTSWKKPLITGIAAATAASLIFIFTPIKQREIFQKSLVTSLYQGKDGSGGERLKSFVIAWDIFKETNGLGSGLGASYRYWTAHHDTRYTTTQDEFAAPSYGNEVVLSTWGQLLAEGGALAVLLYALAGISLILALWKTWRTDSDPQALASFVSAFLFFFFTAFWLGNVARGDVWVWFGLWSIMVKPVIPKPLA